MTIQAPGGHGVPVDGGSLHVLRFGDGRGTEGELAPPTISTVVATHGITGSGMSFGAIARHLPPGWTLLAPDLRGRGRSTALPGPYGLANHARDVCTVVEHGGGGPVVLAGHSMGAYVALLAAASRPELFERLVLVDGGLPLPMADGADLDERLAATLGPAVARLAMTFGSEREYLEFFRAHPALGPHWNDDVAAYVRYDLTGGAGAMRSRVREDAVRADGRELLGDAEAFGTAVRALTVPTLLLTAPDGLFGEPPGFMPEPLVHQWQAQLPDLRAELVPATNHYTILFDPAAAALVAARLTDPSSWPR